MQKSLLCFTQGWILVYPSLGVQIMNSYPSHLVPHPTTTDIGNHVCLLFCSIIPLVSMF